MVGEIAQDVGMVKCRGVFTTLCSCCLGVPSLHALGNFLDVVCVVFLGTGIKYGCIV